MSDAKSSYDYYLEQLQSGDSAVKKLLQDAARYAVGDDDTAVAQAEIQSLSAMALLMNSGFLNHNGGLTSGSLREMLAHIQTTAPTQVSTNTESEILAHADAMVDDMLAEWDRLAALDPDQYAKFALPAELVPDFRKQVQESALHLGATAFDAAAILGGTADQQTVTRSVLTGLDTALSVGSFLPPPGNTVAAFGKGAVTLALLAVATVNQDLTDQEIAVLATRAALSIATGGWSEYVFEYIGPVFNEAGLKFIEGSKHTELNEIDFAAMFLDALLGPTINIPPELQTQGQREIELYEFQQKKHFYTTKLQELAAATQGAFNKIAENMQNSGEPFYLELTMEPHTDHGEYELAFTGRGNTVYAPTVNYSTLFDPNNFGHPADHLLYSRVPWETAVSTITGSLTAESQIHADMRNSTGGTFILENRDKQPTGGEAAPTFVTTDHNDTVIYRGGRSLETGTGDDLVQIRQPNDKSPAVDSYFASASGYGYSINGGEGWDVLDIEPLFGAAVNTLDGSLAILTPDNLQTVSSDGGGQVQLFALSGFEEYKVGAVLSVDFSSMTEGAKLVTSDAFAPAGGVNNNRATITGTDYGDTFIIDTGLNFHGHTSNFDYTDRPADVLAGKGSDYVIGDLAPGVVYDGGQGVDTFEINYDLIHLWPFFDLEETPGWTTTSLSFTLNLETGASHISTVQSYYAWGQQYSTSSNYGATVNNFEWARGTDFDDHITGRSTGSQIWGFGGNDTLIGGASDDQLDGGGGNNRLEGHGGEDRLITGGGKDYLDGGAGNDVLLAGGGLDTVYGRDGDDYITLGQGGYYPGDEFQLAYGGSGNDIIHVGGDAKVYGGEGDDHIYVYGNTYGYQDGGEGSDWFYNMWTDRAVQIIESADIDSSGVTFTTTGYWERFERYKLLNGVDRGNWEVEVNSIIITRVENYDLGDDDDELILFGDEYADYAGVLRAEGVIFENIVDAGAGDDTIDTGLGDDIIIGGLGNDTIEGGDGLDTLDYSQLGAGLTISAISGNPYLQRQITVSDANGTAFTDTVDHVETIIGTNNGDVFTIVGSYLNFIAGTGDDEITGAVMNDTVDGGEGDDTLSGEGGRDALTGGAGLDELSGGAGNDNLSGGAGSDIIDGGSGSDTIEGGIGDDTLTGGSELDTFKFGDADGIDTITDYTGGERLIFSTADVAASGEPVVNDNGDGTTTIAFGSTRVSIATLGANPSYDIQRVNDGAGATFTVTAIDGTGAAADDSYNTSEAWAQDYFVTPDVLANDTNPTGSFAITAYDTTSLLGFAVERVEGTNFFRYTADDSLDPMNVGDTEQDYFSYTISDGAQTYSALVRINIQGSNDLAVANPDSATLAEDGSVTIDPIANDTDVDSDTLSLYQVNPANNGTVAIVDGEVLYTPEADFNGTDSFRYRVSDGRNWSEGWVTVTVTPEPDAPVTIDDSYTISPTQHGQTLTFDPLANDSDVDGEALTLVSIEESALGDITINSDGTFDFTSTIGAVGGSETLEYTVEDPSGLQTTGQIALTVEEQIAPVANDDSVDWGGAVSDVGQLYIIPTFNDYDPGGYEFWISSASAEHGSLSLNWYWQGKYNSMHYSVDPEFVGTDTITYTITNALGATSTATISVNVAANQAPVYDDTFNFNFVEDGYFHHLVLSDFFSDPDGDTINIVSLRSLTGNSDPGFVVGSVGGLRPNANFSGYETFEIGVSDGATTTIQEITVYIAPQNDPIYYSGDTSYAVEHGADFTFTPLDLVNNPDGSSTITVAPGADVGTITDNGDGTYTWSAPNADYWDQPTISFTVQDDAFGDAYAMNFGLLVYNDIATTSDSYTLAEDHSGFVFDPQDNDAITGDPVTVVAIDGVSLANQGDSLVLADGKGTITQLNTSADSSFRYTPGADYFGTFSVTYTSYEATSQSYADETITFTVTPVGDLYTTVDDNATLEEEGSVSFNIFDNDTYAYRETPHLTGFSTSASGVNVSFQTDGTVTLTGDKDFSGELTFTATMTSYDFASTFTSGGTITVTPVNDAPVARGDALYMFEDRGASSIDLAANDEDVDGDTLTVTKINGVDVTQGVAMELANGTGSVTLTGTNVSFLPTADYNGDQTLTYTISDGEFEADSTLYIKVYNTWDAYAAQDINLTVAEGSGQFEIDFIPDSLGDDAGAVRMISLGEASKGTLDLPFTNVLYYTPDPEASGMDTFSYTIRDGLGNDTTATINIWIEPFNDAPTGVSDHFYVGADQTITFDLLANDQDIEGDTLFLTHLNGYAVSPGWTGSWEGLDLTFNEDGTLTVDPTGFEYLRAGQDFGIELQYYGTDGEKGFANGYTGVVVFVQGVNDLPTATLPTTSMIFTEDTTGKLAMNYSTVQDVDSSNVTVTLSADSGTFSVNSAGNPYLSYAGEGTSELVFTGQTYWIDIFLRNATFFTPETDMNGEVAVSVTMNDNNGSGDMDAGSFTIDVAAVDDAPEAIATLSGTLSGTEDVPLALDLSALSFTDVDSATLTLRLDVTNGTLAATPTGDVAVSGTGSATLELTGSPAALSAYMATGDVTYTGAADANGTASDTITATLSDGTSDVDVGALSVDLAAAMDLIVITPGATPGTFTENGSAVVIDNGITVGAVDVEQMADGNGDYSSAVIFVSRASGASAADVYGLDFTDHPTLTFDGAFVYRDGEAIVDVFKTTEQATLVVYSHAKVTTEEFNAILRGITFANDGDALPATIDFNWTVLHPITRGEAVTQLGVTLEDDAPVWAGSAPALVEGSEDTPLDIDLSGLSVSDVDSDVLTVTLSVYRGTLAVSDHAGLTIEGNETRSITATGPAADLNAWLDNAVTWTPATNDWGDYALDIKVSDGVTTVRQDTVTLRLAEQNDPAFVDPANASMSEDDPAIAGTIEVFDIDGDNGMLAVSDLAGLYGNLTMDAAGNWTYTRTSDLDSLEAGQQVSEFFSLNATDGTPTSLEILIDGVNDTATFAQLAPTMLEGEAQKSGVIAVSDPDGPDALIAGSFSGQFGTLELNADGQWSYNRSSDLSWLLDGQTIVENFHLSAADGTEALFTLTIIGQSNAGDGTDGDDLFVGDENSSQYTGYGGDDRFVGGDGEETVHYLGSMSDFAIGRADSADFLLQLTDLNIDDGLDEGTDLIDRHIDKLMFGDGSTATISSGKFDQVRLFDADGKLVESRKYDTADRRKWSEQSAEFNQAGQLTGKATAFDNGKTWRMEFAYDAEGNRVGTSEIDGSGTASRYNWQRIDKTFLADGKKESVATLYDDGTMFSESFAYDDSGNLVTVVLEDGEGAASTRNWSRIEKSFDSTGQLTSEDWLYDNGSTWLKEIEYDLEGNRVAIRETDGDGAASRYKWQSIEKTFTDIGKVGSVTTIFDNGKSLTKLYDYNDAGQRIGEVQLDGDGAASRQKWSSIEKVFNDEGKLTSEYTVFDKGGTNLFEYDYNDAGKRTSIKRTDGDGDASRFEWQSIEKLFADNGDLLQIITTEDDGDVITEFFENGKLARVESIDYSNAQEWWSETVFYGVDGVVDRIDYIPDSAFLV